MNWGSRLSIYARVNAEYEKHFASRGDDYDTTPIIDSLTPEELELWLAECDVEDDLRPEHGLKPDFHDIVEREIYARGIEQR